MRKFVLSLLILFFIGTGCEKGVKTPAIPLSEIKTAESGVVSVVLPIAEYGERRILKAFGEYIEDRFRGYHVGDDIEYTDSKEEVPVLAIATGRVHQAGRASGYGGVMVIEHQIGDDKISAVYGHLDPSSIRLPVGDKVMAGQQIAFLGEHESKETDGERKHLHFGLYKGDEVRLAGYVPSADKLNSWINPQDFFAAQGITIQSQNHLYDPAHDLGGNFFKIQFSIPDGWEVEYVPSIKSLNLFTLFGNGTARERSQIFIRYFDASEFLTLQTVKIHSAEEVNVGVDNYVGRRYDIEKKSGIPPFPDQPSWRNARHIVTDFRDKLGFTRYYVIAANPELDPVTYKLFLSLIRAN